MKRTVAIIGPVTGRPLQNTPSFDAAERAIDKRGDTPLNPRKLPTGMERKSYLIIADAYVKAADLVVMLDGWEKSAGATEQFELAHHLGKPVIHIHDYTTEPGTDEL